MPPRAISAVAESSSEDEIEVLNKAYKDDTSWDALNVQSMSSIPFSDTSHLPYGQESPYLASTSTSKQQLLLGKRPSRSLALSGPCGNAGCASLKNSSAADERSVQSPSDSVRPPDPSDRFEGDSSKNAPATADSIVFPFVDRLGFKRTSLDNFVSVCDPQVAKRSSALSLSDVDPPSSAQCQSAPAFTPDREGTAPFREPKGSPRGGRRASKDHQLSRDAPASAGSGDDNARVTIKGVKTSPPPTSTVGASPRSRSTGAIPSPKPSTAASLKKAREDRSASSCTEMPSNTSSREPASPSQDEKLPALAPSQLETVSGVPSTFGKTKRSKEFAPLSPASMQGGRLATADKNARVPSTPSHLPPMMATATAATSDQPKDVKSGSSHPASASAKEPPTGGIVPKKSVPPKLMAPLPAFSPPSMRPSTRAGDDAESKSTKEKDEKQDAVPGSKVRTVNESRLVAFVNQVSDPEALWVIYDFLCESNNKERYKETIAACKELLDQKEFLLQVEQVKARNAQRFRSNAPIVELVDSNEDDEEDDDIDSADDEFDDFNIRDAPYPYKSDFKYGEPTVSGTVTKVFFEGMLYRIKDELGAYHFFNDTLHEVIMVRVTIKVNGREKFNERAIVNDVKGSTDEKEVSIAVLPEETTFFCSGVERLPPVTAKAVAMPKDYNSPSVTKSMTTVGTEINAVRHAMGKWSKASDQGAFLKCCVKKSLKFTDLNFRPSATTLYRPDIDFVEVRAVSWKRPEDYLVITEVVEQRLFRGEINCQQVRQGELPDHTVVAAMAAVALYPSHVRWMFRHPVSALIGKSERAIGAYRVNLLHNGWWVNNLIDDYFPATLTGPLFSRCVGDPRRLWVSLLEKAYAKSCGSYSAICVADVLSVLSDFTGFPVRPIDEQWLSARSDPKGPAADTFFKYLQRCVRSRYFILVFTPAPSDENAEVTKTLSRKRSSRFVMPTKQAAVPQFLPGHIYFLCDAAHYQELDLRMVRLRNPWTWETRNVVNPAKKWKHTTWYEQPEQSFSMMNLSLAASRRRRSKKEADAFMEDRVGTMWLLWEEALQAFGGGGVCYTSWSHHQYRVRNSFSPEGFPQNVLEISVTKKTEGFVTVTLEGLQDEYDDHGNVLGTNATPITSAVAIRVSKHNKPQTKETVAFKSCEDIECIAGKTTFVRARDVSMKVTFDSAMSPYYIIPQMEILGKPGEDDRRFVVSLLLDNPVSDGTVSINFKSIPSTCEVFTDAPTFSLSSCTPFTTSFQCCTHKGFTEGTGRCIVEKLEKKDDNDS